MLDTYFIASTVVGLIVLIDAVILYRAGGIARGISLQVSLLELIWAIVSLWVLWKTYNLKLSGWWLPACYLAYFTALALWPMWSPKNTASESEYQPPETYVPPALIIVSGLCGLIFALLAAYYASLA